MNNTNLPIPEPCDGKGNVLQYYDPDPTIGPVYEPQLCSGCVKCDFKNWEAEEMEYYQKEEMRLRVLEDWCDVE